MGWAMSKNKVIVLAILEGGMSKSEAARRYGRLALEVRQEPPNEPSLAFHSSRGFEPVGVLGEPGHRNTLMVKELPRG